LDDTACGSHSIPRCSQRRNFSVSGGDHGTTIAHTEVYSTFAAIRRLYASVGFRVAYRIGKYVREF
jgi:hypothetical protein